MDRFSRYNPKACFLFFIFAVVLTLVNFNPYFLIISLAAGAAYNIILQGRRAVKMIFSFLLPFSLCVGLFNMLFNHYGVSVLFKIGDYSFTIEAFFYGLCQGLMFSAVNLWCSCYSIVLDSEKFTSIFSRLAPNLTLVLTMSLSFLPRLRKNAQQINDALKNIENGESKFKKSLSSFSALVSLTLEESIEVSDSMRARGFNSGRRAYSKYRFGVRDGIMIFAELALFICAVIMKNLDMAEFIFEPKIENISFSPAFAAVYGIFMMIPIIIDVSEGIKWHYLKQKI